MTPSLLLAGSKMIVPIINLIMGLLQQPGTG